MESSVELSLWRKKQVALLYYFASTKYLEGLHLMISNFEKHVSSLIHKAGVEGRDQFLVDKKWARRNTSDNWSNCAWPFLADFQVRTAEEIADRAANKFYVTGSNECQRGMSEYSLQWTSPSEERALDAMMHAISMYALEIDSTMDRSQDCGRWDDFCFACAWKEHAEKFRRLPKLRLRNDIVGEHGRLPPITGVYVPLEDEYGAPQFAWTGTEEGALLECSTFNQIGLGALAMVGRRDLWFNEQRMYAFATSPKYRALFAEEVFLNGFPNPALAPSAVSREAFMSQPRQWAFVEMVEGEFEDYDDNDIPGVIHKRIRVMGGEVCPEDGFYMTPAKLDSHRHFKAGEIMPDFANPNWTTIWQSTDE